MQVRFGLKWMLNPFGGGGRRCWGRKVMELKNRTSSGVGIFAAEWGVMWCGNQKGNTAEKRQRREKLLLLVVGIFWLLLSLWGGLWLRLRLWLRSRLRCRCGNTTSSIVVTIERMIYLESVRKEDKECMTKQVQGPHSHPPSPKRNLPPCKGFKTPFTKLLNPFSCIPPSPPLKKRRDS